MLSQEMTYSSAFWPDSVGGPDGDLTMGPIENDLEIAQLNKIHHVLRKARVKAGDRVLEFGSGWGAMAIEAAKLGAMVDTLTLSVEQKKGAESRIRDLGLQDMIRVHLLDYRKVPEVFAPESFDCHIAVEMIEVSIAFSVNTSNADDNYTQGSWNSLHGSVLEDPRLRTETQSHELCYCNLPARTSLHSLSVRRFSGWDRVGAAKP
jgi:hypothetical protein